jgi:serine/threonine protein kinase/tetratricopeptide (TPR) repeat protein
VAVETLAAKLVGEMIHRWRQGERPLAEDLLARHPELYAHPEAAADLIYEELCLRQEYGASVPVEEVLRRFPQWRPQLEVLFDCQRLLGPRPAAPQFPAAGELLGDFLLLADLGGGAQGRVFLASQLSLADRSVVLKLTPLEAGEHLSLARLQHTHIVPLYSVQDHPARALRALCMPYFGGATLAQLLEALRPLPPARRTGQDMLDALDRKATQLQNANCKMQIGNLHFAICNSPSPAWQFLAQASYVEAVCWIGACLADALHYAHERGLVHLDLKPANGLLAADGQPMVLDFHLAREPIHPDERVPPWLGGTAGYMSPEQQAAVQAVQQGLPVTRPVDGRSDIYSLGVVLYEALAGSPPVPGEKPRPLHRVNPQVSVGLWDVIRKCLVGDAGDRYPDMAALAADLRRHLADLPLAGVRNRSLAERWRKWRRRRPYGMALAGMMLAVLTAAAAVAFGALSHVRQRLEEARTALIDGGALVARGEWEGAISTLSRGRAAARGVPFQRDLADELGRQLGLAEQARTAARRTAAGRELHQLADRVRFLYGANHVPPQIIRGLAAGCRAFWENRARVVERLSNPGSPALEPVVRDDLLDLAIFWADLQVRLAPPAGKPDARRKALTVLAQAESLVGASPVLDEERRFHGAPLTPPRKAPPAQTAWEHYALARSLLRSGNLDRAAAETERAVRLQPQGLWPNFYRGLCAYRRGRYADAALAYSVCVGTAPQAAGCFYNRALALAALGRTKQALLDYDRALRLDPALAAAALNRGMLHYRAKRYAAALADLERARKLGADPAVVSFDLALAHLARGERAAALADLRRSLRHHPHPADARKLHDRLLSRERRPGKSPPPSARPKGGKHFAPAPGPNSR